MAEVSIENGIFSDDEIEVEEEAPAWPQPEIESSENDGTPLFELKSRRDKIASEMVKSFQVARWESPEIFCEFSVIEPTALSKALQRREKQKNRKDDWVAWAYCDILSANCKAVYACVNEDYETRYSLRKGDSGGKLTRVDHDLARALGLDPNEVNAAETFRALFFSEGDLLDLANRVFRWSSIVSDEADETF